MNINRLLLLLWLSIVANIALLFCLTWLMIKPSSRTSLGSNVAAAVQMKPGYENGPIILLLDNEFDKNTSFTLFDKDQGLSISKDNAPWAGDGRMKRVSISIKEDLDLTFFYVPEPVPGFREFHLTMGDRVLEDLNADGQYDFQLRSSSAKMANGHFDFCIWYNNEWQEVMGGLEAKYRSANTLKNGVKVNFDRTTGRWVPVMPSIQE